MTLQKLAFRDMRQADALREKKCLGLPMNMRWWLGFLLLVVLPLPFDFLALGLDQGDLDTSKDGLELCQNLEQDYGTRGVHL